MTLQLSAYEVLGAELPRDSSKDQLSAVIFYRSEK
mgnify:CR=1 FL=1